VTFLLTFSKDLVLDLFEACIGNLLYNCINYFTKACIVIFVIHKFIYIVFPYLWLISM